jgi:ABC-2 type transport system permease protein
VSALARYAALLGVQIRTSLVTAMQYRIDFVIEGLMSIYWISWNVIPLLILFAVRDTVGGWDLSSSLIVIGWFTCLRGLLEGAINPSLVDVVERIRTGAFDYLLLKPVDAQFLVSTVRFEPWRVVDILAGLALVVYACARGDVVPSAGDVVVAAVLLLAATVVLYSGWILIVAACFWVVRLDNLTYLFTSVFDAARWPVQIFRGAWRVVFTLIIPIGLMTTYPAMALLGTLGARTAWLSLAAATGFAVVARLVWGYAIRHYTSASS